MLRRHPSRQPLALFALGFRPFFLVAALAAVALIALWLADYGGALSVQTYYGGTNWHGHEMIFGYAAAVVAGFLLTAVRNWTSMDTLRGGPLGALLALWIAGRLAPFAAGVVPGWLIAAVDLTFLPALTASLALPLLRRRQWRNLPFVPVLLLLAFANALVHLDVLGVIPGRATTGLYLGVDVLVLLIAVIGGRVIPFFTQRALPGAQPRMWRPVEWVSISAVAALAVLRAVPFAPKLTLALAAVAALVHAVRLWGWSDRRLWSVPLLWILYAGYGWVVIGFALEALAAAAVIWPQLALHAFTTGAIGTLTLGMMARVALGHTGRSLHAAPAVVAAFVLVNVAALLRVFGAWWLPDDWYLAMVVAAGVAWLSAFVLFFSVYAPILTKPRTDGLEG
ncbi:MAG: NnrS family protein [Candidatus Binatia bacterium]